MPGRPGYSYVRLGAEVSEVRNSRVITKMDGLPILIGVTAEQPDLTQVLTVNHGAAALLSTMLDYLSAHAPTHRLFATNGGSDVVWVEGYQIMPGRLGPVSSSVSVTVYPFTAYSTATGLLKLGDETLDLSAHVPSTVDKVAMVLISVDTTGDFVQTKGSEVDWPDLAPLTDTPAPPSGTWMVLGAVRVYYGQVNTRMTKSNRDIMDLRWVMPYHTHPDLAGGAILRRQRGRPGGRDHWRGQRRHERVCGQARPHPPFGIRHRRLAKQCFYWLQNLRQHLRR